MKIKKFHNKNKRTCLLLHLLKPHRSKSSNKNRNNHKSKSKNNNKNKNNLPRR